MRYNSGNWLGVASSADGTKLVAVASSGKIATSNDSGETWTARMTDQNRNWYGVASSADGTKLVACIYGGQLYTSTDSGVNWTARDSSRDWQSVASSADGTHLIASVRNDGLIYVSTDSGVTWSSVDSARNWWGVGISADGTKLLASVYGGQLYTLGSAPEIAVEQPALTDLSSGSTTDFGSVLTGDTADLTFTIRNPGNLTLTGLDTTIDGTDAGLFTLTASPTGPLDPSDTTTFTVRFAPLNNGLKSATLHIASNDSDENPFDLILNGTGAGPAPEIAVEQPESTDLMTGAMTDFGSAAANSTVDLTFTIRNTGTADLTGVDVTVDGTDSALFTVTATPDSVITPAGSTTFTVRFAPVSTGLKSATLHIASNDGDENPFDLSLTGTGTPEQMIARDSSSSWRGIASSADGVKLVAVITGGHIHTSTDSGATWTARPLDTGPKNWYAVASSADGTKLVAVADGARIHTSIDSGLTWTEQFNTSGKQWRTVASSADGTKLIAGANQDRLYTSTDSGATWTGRYNNGNWNGVASSADGTKLVAVENSGNIFTSTDSGANWTSRMTDQNRNWYGAASSADGTKLVACVYDGQLYTSTDSGATWTARDSSRLWRSVASSADGTHLIASERDGLIYVSTDSGVNWTTLDSTRDWYGVAISADGAKLFASVYNGQLYTLGSAPEIAVEQPALTDLSSGGTTDFGSVLTGDTADLTFTIRNPGTETLTGLGITIDGTDSGLFTLTASPTGPLTGPAGSTTFTVRFAPLSNGLKSATLHIASNDGDENPFNIVLNGTGAGPAPEIVVEQPADTDLMTGAMQDFGSVAANSTTDLTFTIRNSGTADLTGVDVTVEGTDSTLFTVTATPDSVITPAGSTTFTVRFAPVNTGLKSATLHIASNDADENPFDLSLTGTGTPEQMIAQGISQSWRGVTSSADGVKMAAVANNGYLHTSTDSGLTWTSLTALGQKIWYDVASSNDGSKLVAVADGKRIFTSIDSGANWTEQFGSNSNVQWRTVASSADGAKLIAAANQDRIYTSTDSGVTWTVRFNSGNWHGVASSADGTKLVAVENSGNIFTSTDSGASWTARMTDQSRNWFSVASSADGTKLVASVYGGQLYTSIDSGITWTARDSSRNWRLVASSADGSQLIAAERDGLIYVSSDSGVNWTTLDSTRDWYGVAISADGAKLLASVFGGQLYTLGTASDVSQSGPDYVVTTIDDLDDGIAGIAHTSLREAINAANANPDLSIISFDPTVFGTAQIIQLQSELPTLASNLEIQGTSAGLTVRRDALTSFNIFQVSYTATVVLRDLTVTNGAPDYGSGGVHNSGTLTVDHCVISDNMSPGDGGGIENYGTLTVTHSTIYGNSAGSGGGGIQSWSTLTVTDSIIRDNTATYGGGGIDIGEGSATVSGSTISANSAPAGGGMRHLGSGLLTVSNSTISGNSATGSTTADGGGAFHLNANYGGGGTGATLDSVTITANTAPNQSGGSRQGLWAAAGDLSLRNTIIVGNGTQDLEHDGGTLLSLGHNLIGMTNAATSFTATGDQAAITDAGLEPLADNGGGTATHALKLASPALNAGATSLTVDQRGEPRPSGSAADIGAFELYIAPTETAIVELGDLSATYDGNPHAVSVTTTPTGLTTTVTYAGSTTVPTNAGSYAVVATVTGTTHHGSASGTLVIAKAQSNVTWSTPIPVTYGTALSSTQLNATANVSGVFTYSPLPGTVLGAGLKTLDVSFVPTDTTNYLDASGSQNLLVNQATAIVSLSELTPTYDGSPKSAGVETTPSGLSTSVTYDGGSTAPTNAGSYPVLATITDANYAGSVSGSLVIAKATPVITWTPASPQSDGYVLDSAVLNASADVAGTLAYTPIAGTALNLGDNTVSVNFTPADTVNYLAAEASRTIDVQAVGPAFTQNPVDQDVFVGDSINLSVVATGSGPLSYQWRKDTVELTGQTSSTLSISTATAEDAGSYDVVVTNSVTSVTSAAATVTVSPVQTPTITSEPTDQVVLIGSTASFTVEATGGDSLTYQWRKDTTPIANATAATFEISPSALADAGSYDVVVTNNAGDVTSASASLTVIDLVASHEVVGSGYTPGGTVTITNTITYAAAISSIGWSVLPPDSVDNQHWSYASGGGNVAQVSPQSGDTDLFDWAWTTIPPSPVVFTYTLNVPANATGEKSLIAMVKPRFNGVQLEALVPPDPLVMNEVPPFHSADTNQDSVFSLTELLRVIELYNTRFGTTRTGRYQVEDGTEDGFSADPSLASNVVVVLSKYHAGDSNQDGKFSLTELLRIIELYNYREGTRRTGRYHPQLGTEDGFAPGPAE